MARATARRGGKHGWWAAGTLVAGAVLMFCYLRLAGVTQVNSDGAGLVWQAWDMLHGNVLLHGWWATDVSFYTTELPEYAAVTAAAGLRPEVVHICSALTYTLLVLLAAYVARGRARGAEGVVRALLAAGLILAPQPTGPTLVLLGNPDHVGTAVPVLVLLLLLDWARPRWWVPVAAGALLAWSIIGDPLIEVVGAVPLFAACGLRACWKIRSQAPGESAPPENERPPRPGGRAWSAAWYELSLAAAAVASVPLAAAGNWLLRSLGGMNVANAWYTLQSVREIVRGLPVVWESVLALFGADYAGVHGAGNVAFALVHLIGVAVVLAATAATAWTLARRYAALVRPQPPQGAVPGDLVTDILVLAVVANVAAFLLLVPMENVYSAHEIGPVLAFGAALAGRVLGGRILAAARHATGLRRAVLPVFAAVLACYALTLGVAAAHRQAPPRNIALTSWLLRHHLTGGLAPYWEASSITVDSGGKITVLAVTGGGKNGHITPQHWETDVRLGEPARSRHADFVILSPAERQLRHSAVLATFGPSAGSYRVGPYTVLVWHGNLLPKLTPKPAVKTVSVTRPGG